MVDSVQRLYLLGPKLFMSKPRPIESFALRIRFQDILYEAVPSFRGTDGITACARLYYASLCLTHLAVIIWVFDEKVERHFYQDLKELESDHSPENRATSRFVGLPADIEANLVERVLRALVEFVEPDALYQKLFDA